MNAWEKMPRLLAELHGRALFSWERARVKVLGFAKLAIKAKMEGLGYGG